MATKFECDRCGNQTSDRNDIGEVSYPGLDYHKNISRTESDSLSKDLCVKCIRELHDFVKPIPKNNFL